MEYKIEPTTFSSKNIGSIMAGENYFHNQMFLELRREPFSMKNKCRHSKINILPVQWKIFKTNITINFLMPQRAIVLLIASHIASDFSNANAQLFNL